MISFNVAKTLNNSVVFIFMKEYVLERNVMNVFSIMKPLHTSIVFIIMKLFILERNFMNVSNVVNPLCYEIHGVPTQFKHKDNANDKNILWSNL